MCCSDYLFVKNLSWVVPTTGKDARNCIASQTWTVQMQYGRGHGKAISSIYQMLKLDLFKQNAYTCTKKYTRMFSITLLGQMENKKHVVMIRKMINNLGTPMLQNAMKPLQKNVARVHIFHFECSPRHI